MQKFQVDIELSPIDNQLNLTSFRDQLSKYGSPQFVSYHIKHDADIRTMMLRLEFDSYEDAVAFAQAWFCESVESAVEYVETITV